MVRIVRGFAVTVSLLPLLAFAQQLPIKAGGSYKNGVGYFEHVGPIRDNQEISIPFTSGQLNDVLKSLTVLDLNGGRIKGVTYGSAAPLDRQLGDLHLAMGEKSSLSDFLGALRGARLEIRSGTTTITGRLLSVDRKTRISGGTTLEVDYLSLLAENGEVKTTEGSRGSESVSWIPGLPDGSAAFSTSSHRAGAGSAANGHRDGRHRRAIGIR